MWRHLLKWLGPLCSLLLLGTALTVLYHLTQAWHWHDIRVAIWSQPLLRLAGALLLTLLSYGCLCSYDMLALHALGKRLPGNRSASPPLSPTPSPTPWDFPC